jgi:hypothetical protein
MKIATKKVIPAGVYDASFDGVELTDHPEYGAGLCWAWTILRGQFKGQQVFRTTKRVGTSKNSCGKFLLALTALPLEMASTEDTNDYIGRDCSVIVELSEGGSSRVESFFMKSETDANATGTAA